MGRRPPVKFVVCIGINDIDIKIHRT